MGMSDPSELRGLRVVLVPLAPEHLADLRRIRALPEVEARWGIEELTEGWPADAEPGSVFFAILEGGVVAGMIQYGEETEPMYRHASIDIFIDPAFHNRGLGRDAVGTLARYLIEVRGHHRITIDPAADNLPAIRAYAAVGFRPVGVMRDYERNAGGNGWHDGLLMDLLPGDLAPGLAPGPTPG